MDKDFETEVLTRLARIETKLDDYDNLKNKVEELRAKTYANERRITDIEDKNRWLERTIIGAIITGGISIIYLIIRLGLKI
jgi:predicted  nucleic acid-binding Zn-ribbon protein